MFAHRPSSSPLLSHLTTPPLPPASLAPACFPCHATETLLLRKTASPLLSSLQIGAPPACFPLTRLKPYFFRATRSSAPKTPLSAHSTCFPPKPPRTSSFGRTTTHLLTRSFCSVETLLLISSALVQEGNESLYELHVARNANIANGRALEYHPKSNKSATVCNTNETCRDLEVADTEDKDSKDGADDRSPSICSRLISELSVGIDTTRHLQFLDLSENKLSSEAIESLYSSWSSARSRSNLVAYKHENEDHILHFCAVRRRFGGVRSCCRKY